VSLIFLPQAAAGTKVFSSLNSGQPRWVYLYCYYKLKAILCIVWALEVTVTMMVISSVGINVDNYISTILLTFFGLILDLYHAYCIYSCYELGSTGILLIHPLPISTNVLSTQNNEEIYVAQEAKDAIARPVQPPPPKLEAINIVDFTQTKEDNK
jgi:hypothetical protein